MIIGLPTRSCRRCGAGISLGQTGYTDSGPCMSCFPWFSPASAYRPSPPSKAEVRQHEDSLDYRFSNGRRRDP